MYLERGKVWTTARSLTKLQPHHPLCRPPPFLSTCSGPPPTLEEASRRIPSASLVQGRRSNSNSNPYQSFNSNSNSVSAEAGAGASLSGRLDAAVAELAAVTADPELSVHARGFEVHSVREDAAVRLHDLGQRLRRELAGAEERRLQVCT